LIPQTKFFKKELPKHLQNQVMRRNISRATWHSLEKRSEVVAEIPEWEELREKAHQIKRQVINQLSENLDTFDKCPGSQPGGGKNCSPAWCKKYRQIQVDGHRGDWLQ
jgi:L-lactate utilization protein LutB